MGHWREANFVVKIIFYLCMTEIFIQGGYTDSRRTALPLLGSKAPSHSLFYFVSFFFLNLTILSHRYLFFLKSMSRVDFALSSIQTSKTQRSPVGLGFLAHS